LFWRQFDIFVSLFCKVLHIFWEISIQRVVSLNL
jgi:hypothetical protein